MERKLYNQSGAFFHVYLPIVQAEGPGDDFELDFFSSPIYSKFAVEFVRFFWGAGGGD